MFCGHVADLACWAPPDGRGRVENDLHLYVRAGLFIVATLL